MDSATVSLTLSRTTLPSWIAALFVAAALMVGAIAIGDSGSYTPSNWGATQADEPGPAGPRGLAAGLSGR